MVRKSRGIVGYENSTLKSHEGKNGRDDWTLVRMHLHRNGMKTYNIVLAVNQELKTILLYSVKSTNKLVNNNKIDVIIKDLNLRNRGLTCRLQKIITQLQEKVYMCINALKYITTKIQ